MIVDEKKGTISVMIPTYNEEENVVQIYEAVRDTIKKDCMEYDYEIVIIDNKSTDNTRTLIRQICAEDKKVKAIFNCKNFGQFNSPYYGIINTSGDCTITICADFQDPVEMIPVFVKEWEKGNKIVIGKKTASKENPIVYILRGIYYKLLKKMSNVNLIEQFTGFGLYDRSFVNTLRDLKDPTPFIRGIVAELGPERVEVEYTQPKRRAGKTHNNFFSLFDAAMLGFTSYTKAGMRLAFVVGLLFGMVGLLTLVFAILGYCGIGTVDKTTLLLFATILIIGAGQFMFLGLLGEYTMGINLREMNRPLVIEEERLNFDNSDSSQYF